MRTRSKIVLAALAAMLVLGVAVGIASARRLEISEPVFLFKWPTTAPLSFSATGASVVCSIRMKGSFHSRTISKVSGQLIGLMEEARKISCSVNEAWVLNGIEKPVGEERVPPTTLPWHILYLSFAGTLPAISRVRIGIIRASILGMLLIGTCLYQSTAASPLVLIVEIRPETGEVLGLRPEEAATIPKFSGNIMCPNSVSLSSRLAEFTELSKSPNVVIRLVL